jgi:hypothetical protein
MYETAADSIAAPCSIDCACRIAVNISTEACATVEVETIMAKNRSREVVGIILGVMIENGCWAS